MDESAQELPRLADLVEQHYRVVYRFAYRLCGSQADAEDLTQQTFLAAQANLHQLREAEAARSWLFTIARNTFLKSQRSPAGHVVPLEYVGEPLDHRADHTRFDGLEREELQAVLDELPEEFRTPLVLFYFQEFSYKQIARQMDLPIGTVMSRLARAKEHLRRRLLPESSSARAAAGQPAG
jgi:RNA polymerase sigma-70 factor (ECF subfamily)